MKKIYLVLLLGLFVALVVIADGAWAARELTRSDVQRMIAGKSEEIALIAANKATARLNPRFKAINSTLDTLRVELDRLMMVSDKEKEYLQPILARLDANVKEIQSASLGNAAQLSNMTVATNESLKNQKEEISGMFEAQRESLKEDVSKLTRKIEELEADLNKRSVMRTAVTLGGVGMAIAFIAHILDHEGR